MVTERYGAHTHISLLHKMGMSLEIFFFFQEINLCPLGLAKAELGQNKNSKKFLLEYITFLQLQSFSKKKKKKT